MVAAAVIGAAAIGGAVSAKQKSKPTKNTPIISDWMKPNLENMATKSNDFMNSDPTQYVAPASDLQTKSWDKGSDLGGWKSFTDEGMARATAAGDKPAPTTTAYGYDAPQLGGPALGQAVNLGGPAQASAYQLGPAAQAAGVQLGPTNNAQAYLSQTHSLLDNGGPQRYMDPAIDSYVKNTLSSYDANSDNQRAQMAAAGARTGAFKGSRAGVTSGQFEADTGRNRALTESELRSQAYAQALQAAGVDANLAQGTDISNAGLQTQVSGMNASAANQMAQAQGGLDWNRNALNTNAQNQFQLAQGQFNQDTGMYNTDALNRRTETQGGFDASRYAADQAARNQFSLTQGGFDANAAQFGASAMNSADQFNASMQEQEYQRALQAAGLIGDLGNSYASNERADVGLLADLGAQQRGIDSEFRNAVPTQLQIGGNLLAAIPPAAYIGQKSQKKQSALLGGIGGAMQGVGSAGGAGLFSDRRLKTDIEQVGNHGELGLYRFRYIWDDRARFGVMADEVAIHAPEALGPTIAGYATVDYGKLGLAHLVEG